MDNLLGTSPNSKPSESGFGFERRCRFHLSIELEKVRCGTCRASIDEGQANKSARGMPWHQEPMKDVISCDKLRGAANELRSGDLRMGKPTERYHILNKIGI